MSQPDLPLWVRGLALVLLLFAAWWLLATDVLRDTIGDSVGLLGLAVISVSILRGMHLRLGIWPEGPWRSKFATLSVVATALVFAVLILLAGWSASPVLSDRVDVGTAVLVVIGAVFWGYSVAFVKQRAFLHWFALAVGVAIVPLMAQLVSSAGEAGFCFVATGIEGAEAVELRCQAALLPSLTFLLAVGAATGLVTEELAFRRILIGGTGGAGLASVIAAAAAVVVWYALMVQTDIGTGSMVWLGGLGGVIAGCLYVLSRSLLVSACFNATFMGGFWAMALSWSTAGESSPGISVEPAAWIAAAAAAAILAVLVHRKNGLVGDSLSSESIDALGD